MAFRLLITAFFILLISADVSQAEPVSAIVTAIGAAIKASLTAAALVKAALAIAVNVGMGLIKQAQAKKAQRKQEPRGTTLSVQFGDTRPLSYMLGTKATAGRRYYAGTWGSAGKTPNAFATDCRVISDLPSYNGPQGLQEAWFGPAKGTILWDQPHPQGWGFPVLEFRSSGTDYLWVKYYDGTQTVADPFLLATFGALTDHPYLPTMIGRGCQLVIYTCRVNETLFPQGFPDALFVPKPMKLYDLRFDTTAGGSGPQRWGDVSTYQSSDLLPVMMYNVARGMYYDGQWVHGGRNFAAHRLPASSWMAAINEADRAMEEGRKQFRGGLEVFVDEEPLDTLEDMRVGCAGSLADIGGALKLSVGSPPGAVFSFTDANVVVTSDQGYEPFPSVKSTHNTITSDYPEPKERWKYKDAPEKSSAELLARDGGQKLPVAVRFEAVPFSAQVQSLMSAMIAEEQRWRVHDFALPPSAKGLEPNDVLSWTSEKQSYGAKRFSAKRVTRLSDGNVRVMMKEIDPSDYNPPVIIIHPVIGWTGTIVAPPQPMTGWTVEPYTVRDTSGRPRRPGIKVKCAPELDDVRNVRVKVRLKSSGALVFDSDATPYGAPHEWIISGQWTLPDTVYQASGLLIPFSNRPMEPSEWIDVTTPNVQLIADDVLDGAIIASKIADGAATADKIANEAITSLKLAAQAVTQTKIALGAIGVDQLGNSSVISSKIADAAIIGSKLAAEAIDATKFASSIEPVTIVTAGLPTTRVTASISYLGKLYRWNGTAYVIGAAAGEIVGQITSTQIADDAITTPKIAANAITAAELDAFAVTAGKVAAGAISTAELAAGAITTPKLAAGVITTDKLAVGTGANQIPNADFSAGITNWSYGYSTGGAWASLSTTLLVPGIANYGIATGSLSITQTTPNVGVVIMDVQPTDVATGLIKTFTVAPGKKYELSVYTYGHRSAYTRAHIGWVNAAGATISYDFADAPTHQNGDPQQNINNYLRIAFMAVAPPTAVAAQVFFRVNIDSAAWGGVGGNWTWLAQPYFGEALPNQTQPSAWTSGATTLISSGNIVTGHVTAEKIATGAIVAGKIAVGAITAVDIAAATITGAKIAADTIGANNIAVTSIYARHLLLTDFTNLVANGNFDSSDLTSVWDVFGNGQLINIPNYGITGSNAALLQKNVLTPANDVWMSTKPAFYIPILGNTQYYFEAAIATNLTPAPAGFFFRVSYMDVNKNPTGVFVDVAAGAPISSVWTKYSGKLTTPGSNANFIQIVLYNNSGNTVTPNLLIDRVIVRKANAAELIVDGGITANHINVTSLSAISANLGSVNISSAIIGTLSVGTSNIAAGAVTGYATVSFPSGSLGPIDGSRDVSVVVPHPDPATTPGLVIRGDGAVSGNQLSSAAGSIVCTMLGAGSGFGGGGAALAAGGGGSASGFGVYAPANGTTSTTMTLRITLRGSVTSGFAMFQVFKK